MISRLAIARLQGVIALSLIIVASSVSIYYHYSFVEPRLSSLEKGEFQLANLIIDPEMAEPGQPMRISVEVTNTAYRNSSCTLNLVINGSLLETQDVQVDSGTTALAEFSLNVTTLGVYSVEIGNLTGTFSIQKFEIPEGLGFSNLILSSYEAWSNETVQISVKASNTGSEAINYPLAVRLNNTIKEIKTIQLSAGATETVEFNITESREGEYKLIVGTLTKKLSIVPIGKHTLRIAALGALPFTINGESEVFPYSELLDVGLYTITVPYYMETFPGQNFIRRYQFINWEDGSTSTTRTINLQSYRLLVANYNYSQSCPTLCVWNGTSYRFAAEISDDGGWLGYVNHFREDGTISFGYNDPWDYIKIDKSQMQPRNGYYDMTITELYDEIFYLDAAKLVVVDHPSNVDVYSTADTNIYNFEGRGKIYTASKNPSAPISATNGNGENILSQISWKDGIFTSGNMWNWDTLELNLGDLSNDSEIKLVISGITVWPTTEGGGDWISQFASQPGVSPQPLPYMEVRNAVGEWVRVPDSRQFPILDVTPETIVVDLSGLFLTNDYSLRINTYSCVRFDYIGVDTTPQQKVTIREVKPIYANLDQVFTTSSTSAGNFTKYGGLLPLVLEADDKLVIGRQGDQVSLRFPSNLGSVPEGMERDFFVVASLWFKGKGHPYMPFTVDPLPFHAMSSYPYASNENYPFDADHLYYLREYNIRVVPLGQD